MRAVRCLNEVRGGSDCRSRREWVGTAVADIQDAMEAAAAEVAAPEDLQMTEAA